MGLEEYVIGQHDVKVALAVGVHNHYKRVQFMVPKDGSELEVSDLWTEEPHKQTETSFFVKGCR